MGKHKTNQLSGVELDLAVAIAQGWILSDSDKGTKNVYFKWPDGSLHMRSLWRPSTDWRDCGPIIEREQIPIFPVVGGTWEGEYVCWKGEDDSDTKTIRGPTPLIAAMRCYVASKLGEEVEL